MKGVVFEKIGAEPKIVDTLKKPKPGPGQVLVKSLWTAINPVDGYMAGTGLLVVDWPLVVAVDASGVVVEAGSEAESKYNLKAGTYVFGCTRLGMTEYAAGQEYFLMDAAVTIPKPQNIDLIQAATVGVGIETAALGLFQGLKIPIFDAEKLPAPKNDWLIVLGGGSSVGSNAIQIAKAAGYKVLSSCSARSADAIRALGAEIFDYKDPINEQVDKVLKITGGKAGLIFDANASNDPEIAKELFKHKSLTSSTKLFSTTNDWSDIRPFSECGVYQIELGPVGRPEAVELNAWLEKVIPFLTKLVEKGIVKPQDYEIIGNGGFDDVIKAYKHKSGGAAGKKIVVKVQDE